MSGRLIKRGRHTSVNCMPGGGIELHGAIWECECGRRWRYSAYGGSWTQTWRSVFGIRPHRKEQP